MNEKEEQSAEREQSSESGTKEVDDTDIGRTGGT